MPVESISSLPEKPRTLVTLIAYEDQPTRDHALRVCDRVAGLPELEIGFAFSGWRFAWLDDPTLAAQATAEAMAADLIVFSTHAGGEFSDRTCRWIESWVDQKKNPPSALLGLLGLVEEHPAGSSSGHQYLRQMAGRAGMDYLPAEVPPSSLHGLDERTHALTPLLKKILDAQPPPAHWDINSETGPHHWGINE